MVRRTPRPRRHPVGGQTCCPARAAYAHLPAGSCSPRVGRENRQMSAPANENPTLDDYRSSYLELFGEMPEVPGKRFDDLAEISPDFVAAFERLRAVGFYSDVFDVRTTQLIAFAHLLRAGHFAAYWHARAARRAGASWQELVKVIEIGVSTDGGMQVLNDGIKVIERLRQEEEPQT